jgi:hypothetical protein
MQLGHFFALMIWSLREGCRTSPYRLPLDVKPPASGRTRASLAYLPPRPTHSTPTSSWPLVPRQSVDRVIRSSSRRRMSATSPAIATPACARPLFSLLQEGRRRTSNSGSAGLDSRGKDDKIG